MILIIVISVLVIAAVAFLNHAAKGESKRYEFESRLMQLKSKPQNPQPKK